MPVRRRGFSGGAEQGLKALQQILAALLQNKMVGTRQKELNQQYMESLRERDEAQAQRAREASELSFQRQASLAGLQGSAQEVAQAMQQRRAEELQRAKDEKERAERERLAAMYTSGEAGRRAVIGMGNQGNEIANEVYESLTPPSTMELDDPTATVPQKAPPLPPPYRTEAEEFVRDVGTPGYIEAAGNLARAGRRTPEEIEADEAAATRGRLSATPPTPAKPTQSQVDAGARLPLLMAAEQQASAIEKAGEESGDLGTTVFLSNLPDWANFLRGDQGQKYRTAVRAIGITSLKTLFPGQLSDQEREAGLALIVPQPFDTPEERQFKAQMRRGLIQIVQSIADGGVVDPEVLAGILAAFQNPGEALATGLQQSQGAATGGTGPDPFVQELINRGLPLPGGGR